MIIAAAHTPVREGLDFTESELESNWCVFDARFANAPETPLLSVKLDRSVCHAKPAQLLVFATPRWSDFSGVRACARRA